jgi:hypothetical protein
MTGGRGTSMKAWFTATPKAQEACASFVTDRQNGSQSPVTSLLATLTSKFGFPFTSEPSLVRHLRTLDLAPMVAVVAPTTETVEKDHFFALTGAQRAAVTRAKRWVITAAQNNTAVNEDFLTSLEGYCDRNAAQLIVRPIRYRNPANALTPEAGYPEGMWWAEELENYLTDAPLEFSKWVAPDIRIPATSGNPLSGLDSRSGEKHAVYAATQLMMRTIPTPQAKLPKILYSTGAVTLANYSTTKSGNLAEFHHSNSAIVVEECSKTGNIFMRALTWDGESFIDIDRQYSAATPKGVKAPRWEALIPGDEHAWFMDPSVEKATYAKGSKSMVGTGKPHVIVRHDLLDCYSVSHHHMADGIKLVNKATHGWGNLEKELNDTIDFLNRTTPKGVQNLIVSSNHNDHLSQWLGKGEKGVTPENAVIYHKLMAAVLESASRTDTGVKMDNPFEIYAEGKIKAQAEFLGGTGCYLIKDIDVSQHGHRGPNGSRGSARNLANIGVKSVIGHSHSPNIYRGVHQVGTSSFYNLEYAQGPSSWLHCHCVIHSNGKRQLLPIIDGDWRAR